MSYRAGRPGTVHMLEGEDELDEPVEHLLLAEELTVGLPAQTNAARHFAQSSAALVDKTVLETAHS